MRDNFYDKVSAQPCNSFGTALTASEYPVSGSYIEVGNFESFTFLIKVGTLTSELTCQVQQADAIDGTAKDISGAVVVIEDDDDNQLVTIEVETAKLDLENDYHYVTLDVTGAAGSDDYADIIFLGRHPRRDPVTQVAAYSQGIEVMG
jgi:hypothetical protein